MEAEETSHPNSHNPKRSCSMGLSNESDGGALTGNTVSKFEEGDDE
jgi:hypothetical protein